MKKYILFVVTAISMLSLTSCKVNWFGETLDVPWYFIAAPVALILVVSYIILISRSYVCPECKTEIRPKWYDVSVCFHLGNKRVLKCPKCGRRGFCERKK